MLPGKLCIGILEEDNPLKSYFRFKPLLVEREGRYEPFTGGENYPEDGCIRIVPDKNESGHFKGRMRRMGRWCVLDLRTHTGEGDKIRPNKNYRGDEFERNANIVYSDVLVEPKENMIFEFAPSDICEGEWSHESPQTPKLIAEDMKSFWSFDPPLMQDAPLRVRRDSYLVDEAQLQRFELQGFDQNPLRFVVRPAAFYESDAVQQRPEGGFVRSERPAFQVKNAAVDAGNREPAATRASAQPQTTEAAIKPSPQPQIVEAKPAPQTVETAAEAPSIAEGKPWLNAEVRPLTSYRRKMSAMQVLEAQSGLNPRHGRSLQEIIEDKWKRSRMDQLGHPVPGMAMGEPLENPLDAALNALNNVWDIPELRDRLLDSLAQVEGLTRALEAKCSDVQMQEMKRELEELEAERLKALSAIEKLRRDKRELRESFKREIRNEEAEALRDAVDRTRAASAELQRVQAQVDALRKDAALAQDAYNRLQDGRFEQTLLDFALASRAAELLREGIKPVREIEAISDDCPTSEEWIERMRRAAAAEGLLMDELQAANLLICAALNDCIMLSGPVCDDKLSIAHALARALGAVDSGRVTELANTQSACCVREASALANVIVYKQANDENAKVDCSMCGKQNTLVLALLTDSGRCIPQDALEHGFLLRLKPASADTPWHVKARAGETFSPVRLSALKDAFITDAKLPPALERRLQRLRDALAVHGVHLSRHTLSMMWQYCAAMIKLGRISAGEALDLAFAQKAMPCVLAEAPLACLAELKTLLAGMPHSLYLLSQPLPIQI